MDLSDFGQRFVSVTSKSTQTIAEFKDVNVQTLFSNVDLGLQNMVNPTLKISADLVEFGVINNTTITNSPVQTLIQTLEKGVNTETIKNTINSSTLLLDELKLFLEILINLTR